MIPPVIRKILAHLALARSGQSPGPGPPESSTAPSGSAPRGRGGPSCLRRETPSALIRPIRGRLTAMLCQP